MLKRIGIVMLILVALTAILLITTQKQPEHVPQPSTEQTVPEEPIKVSFTGTGDTATEKFKLREGLATFKLTHEGTGHFSAWVMDDQGNRVELLVNQIGVADVSHAMKVDTAGEYILNISASGNWSIEGVQ